MVPSKPHRAGFIAALIGLIGFMNVTRSPRFALMHTVDILQLLASGMCLGIALTAVIASRRSAARD